MPPEKPSRPAPSPRRTPQRRSRYTRAEVAEIFARLAAQRPDPVSDLEWRNPFTLLVAVVLSAQATDASVNRATATLFEEADTPAAMLALGEARIGEHIRIIGLWRNKAKNVVELSRRLVEQHGGLVPGDHAALTSLPGVGNKTANVVMNVAFGAPVIAVDTHIFRIGNRLGLAPGATPDEVEAGLMRVVPPAYRLHAHHWLILHGRYVCTARKPACEACVIADLCRWEGKTTAVPAPIVPLGPREHPPGARPAPGSVRVAGNPAEQPDG